MPMSEGTGVICLKGALKLPDVCKWGRTCEQRSIMIPKTQLVQGLAHCLYVLLIQTDEWRATVRTKWSPPFQLQYNSIKSLLMVEHQTASILNWLETQVTFGPNAWMDYCGIALYFVALWSYQERILGRRLIWIARSQLSLGTIKIVAASKMG